MKIFWRVCALWAGIFSSAQAHVVLAEPQAPAGSYHKATLRVGHGCNGSATTGLVVTVPAGFQEAKPQPKAGWVVTSRKAKLAQPYTSHGKVMVEDVVELRWTVSGKEFALPDAQFDEFSFLSRVPDQAGPVWIKVLQTCETGENNWSDIPAAGTSTKGMKFPAALLQLKSDAVSLTSSASIAISDAWVRPTVAGQKATGAFMKITARESTRLVGVSSPVAGIAEIHEMKMDKDIMKMAAIPALNLPSGQTVELKPGGFHLMLMDLKSPISSNSKIPLTLQFQDARGVKSQMEITLDTAMPHQH